jgi:hypothetical protein
MHSGVYLPPTKPSNPHIPGFKVSKGQEPNEYGPEPAIFKVSDEGSLTLQKSEISSMNTGLADPLTLQKPENEDVTVPDGCTDVDLDTTRIDVLGSTGSPAKAPSSGAGSPPAAESAGDQSLRDLLRVSAPGGCWASTLIPHPPWDGHPRIETPYRVLCTLPLGHAGPHMDWPDWSPSALTVWPQEPPTLAVRVSERIAVTEAGFITA